VKSIHKFYTDKYVIYVFQELCLQQTLPLIILLVILVSILAAAQFPMIQSSAKISNALALFVCISATCIIFYLLGRTGTPGRTMILFAVILIVHTMLPLPRIITLALAAVITIAHIVLASVVQQDSPLAPSAAQVRAFHHIYRSVKLRSHPDESKGNDMELSIHQS
jgi:hypothetical protein